MWLDEDLDDALAWQAAEKSKCPGCGHDWVESTDPERAWIVSKTRCFVCEARASETHAHIENSGSADGLYLSVREDLDAEEVTP